MLSMICGLVSVVAFLPASCSPGGVNKATFDKIKVGITIREVEALVGSQGTVLWGTQSPRRCLAICNDNGDMLIVGYETSNEASDCNQKVLGGMALG